MKLKQTLIAFHQLGNALAGGWADETISSRAWRSRDHQPWKTLRPVIDRLFFFEPEHYKSAFGSERQRAHLPPEFRQL